MSENALPGITELAAQFQSGQTTPSAALETCLQRIDAHNGKIAAFELVFAERARIAAEAATKAIGSGHRIGPFHGIAFALKDLIDVEGEITTAGSNAYATNRATKTATIAKRLIAGGGVLVGKTKTVEVAYGPWGTNTQRGTPWNPWDLENHRAPGGSSSGSGAGVASGFATCAVGTDTGGSVRIPASFCGLTGLKTTEGRLPLDGISPLSHTLDTPGPMCRSVRDTAIMFETMDGREPQAIERDLNENTGLYGAMNAGIEGLAIGAMTQDDRAFISADVLAHYDEALKRLEKLGARIVPFAMPVGLDDMRFAVARIIGAECYYYHGVHYENPALAMDEDVKARVMDGKAVTTLQYIEALRTRLAHRALFTRKMAGLAAIVTPSTPITAPIASDIDQKTVPSQLTRFVNHLGFCALSTPMGVAKGLPTSLQIVARGFEEAITLRIGAAFADDFGGIGMPRL